MNKIKDWYGRTATRLGDPSKPYYIQNWIASFFIAFFAVSAIFVKTSPERYTALSYVTSLNVVAFAAMLVVVMAILIMACFLFSADRVLPALLVLAVTVFGCFLHSGGDRNIWMGVGAAVIAVIVCRWIFTRFERPFSRLKFSHRVSLIIVFVLFAAFVIYMSLMGAARYLSFTYNTFDFGIFAQMFGFMKNTGLPYTTVERNALLSHFAVHFSPFFYVLLPGYYVFDTPIYLCVMQTLCVGLGVFAVYGIAKELGFSPKQSLLASVVYLLYPAFAYGLHFDFHENKFLTFCILYTVYFLLKRKFVPFYIFAVLLCAVKEDAAIYLVAIALFMLFHEKLIKHGTITLVLALAYFVFALVMIQVCGADDSMQFAYRYSDFDIEGGASIASIIKITLLNFGYTFKEIFQQEKMEFLVWMFLPVLFMPFVNRKISSLFLLAPMLLVNMMSSWLYQYDVDYQYTYGTGAMIIVCTLLTLIQLPPKTRNRLLLSMAMICIVVTLPRVVFRNNGYIGGYLEKKEMFDTSITFIEETLPKDTVIGVEGDVMPVMFDYPNLYMDPRTDAMLANCEYFVAKTGDGDIPEVISHGLEPYADNGYIEIYKNPNYVRP